MAEKKNVSKKKTKEKIASKTIVKNEKKKTSNKNIKKEVPKVIDTYEAKLKKEKNESKIKRLINKISLEELIIGCTIIIVILLIVLICVASKNTKTKNGDDIVAKVKGKTITANELYEQLKNANGETTVINMIDEYILDKEYKTTDEMKESAKSTIESYKQNYGDNFESFLSYNGIKDEKELKELLIKNSKLTKVTEDYIKENISEKEMKEYYENNIKGDIRAKHILISVTEDESKSDEENEALWTEAENKAKDIIKKLQNGKDFDKLAKKYSDDTATKENGGDLGYFNSGEMVEAFENAAYALEVNQYTTTPVKTEYGYHIIMKTGEKDKPSYKKSKDTIIEKLVEKKKEEDETISVKAMIALRKKYKLNIKDKKVKADYNSYKKSAVTTTTTTAASE